MKAFLKLIRFQNLLIIAATQYLIRYCVIRPLIKISDFELQLSNLNFFLLSLSTVMIAAAGYIINDYFDIKTDNINRPYSVVVGKAIKRRVAMGAHLVINIIACSLGIYLGYKVGIYQLGLIHLFSAGVLWFYSTDFKRKFLVGNLVVSFLTAMVPLMVVLYELPLLNKHYHDVLLEANVNLAFILKFVSGFALFAFLISLIREIIKDMEDVEGDIAIGCKTIPIVLGNNKTKIIVSFLIFTVMVFLGMLQLKQIEANDQLSFYYLLIGIQLPMLLLTLLVWKADTAKQFHNASIFVKIIMLIGILYAFVINYSLTY